MRVNGINSYLYTPNIYPNKRYNYVSRVSFSGIDRFEKTATTGFYDGVKTFYNRLEQDMGILKPDDIKQIASNVVKRTGLDEKNVYNAMGMLTEYSSYKSLCNIEKGLHRKGFYNIESLPVKKELFMWRNPCLADALGYVGKRNFSHSLKTNKSAMVVDVEMLKWLDFIEINSKEYFKDKNPLYIENFENGYNFFNQSKSLEDFTVEKLKKAQHYQNKNGKSILYNLNYVLNGDVLGKLQRRGVDVQILKADIVKNPTPEQIAKNVNPIMPDFNKFYNSIKDIPKNGDVPIELGEKYVLDYLNAMTEIITPRKYGKYLKDIHAKITKYLHKTNQNTANVYHIIPNVEKSFAITNYMYRRANNVNSFKSLFVKTNETFGTMIPNLDILPKNSTLVVMDDYMISGLSMLKEQFLYDELVRNDSIATIGRTLQEKSMNIIFAPIISSKAGKFELENFIRQVGRQDKDKILSAKNMPQFEEKVIYNRERKYNRFQTSIVLPYMGPDTNAEEFIPMYEQFLYNPNAQKPVSENIGDAYEFML